MNRALRFRVWEIDDKCWGNNAYLECHGSDLKHILWCDEPDKYVIEQFTGSLDKDGSEIYEGDLVTYYTSRSPKPNDYGWTPFLSQVVWCEYPFCGFTLEKKTDIIESLKDRDWTPDISYGLYTWLRQPQHMKVLGNIHEHTNLLDKEVKST